MHVLDPFDVERRILQVQQYATRSTVVPAVHLQ